MGKKKKPVEPLEPESPAEAVELHWPDDVRVLTAADLCRTVDYDHESERRGLNGWLEQSFSRDEVETTEQTAARSTLYAVLAERTGLDLAIWEYNDDRRFSLAFLASAWNEMLFRCGYAIDAADRTDDGSGRVRTGGRRV